MAGTEYLFADQWANRDNPADGCSSPDARSWSSPPTWYNPPGVTIWQNGDYWQRIISESVAPAALKQNGAKPSLQPPVVLATVQHRQTDQQPSSFSTSGATLRFAVTPQQ